MEGGALGSKNYTKILFADGRDPDVFGKTAQYHLKKGDVARLITGTGGGYGNPFERPPEKVQNDVKNGYVTVAQADKEYGVVLNPNTLEIERLVGARKE
jgi:N-methylhydantoinase B